MNQISGKGNMKGGKGMMDMMGYGDPYGMGKGMMGKGDMGKGDMGKGKGKGKGMGKGMGEGCSAHAPSCAERPVWRCRGMLPGQAALPWRTRSLRASPRARLASSLWSV